MHSFVKGGEMIQNAQYQRKDHEKEQDKDK
jgi:hypothetical protein